MFASSDVAMGQFIHQYDLRSTRKDRVDIHFLKGGAMKFETAARHSFQFGSEFRCWHAPMCLDDADYDILTALTAAESLTQHAIGLSDAGSISKKDLQ